MEKIKKKKRERESIVFNRLVCVYRYRERKRQRSEWADRGGLELNFII